MDFKDTFSVIIVGGGPCGLNLSCFLSNQGIKNVLFEKHTETTYLPRASYLSERTMEILRQQGLFPAFADHIAPLRNLSRGNYMTSLAGNDPSDRKLFATVIRDYDPSLSPCSPTSFPLIRAEPIWRQLAEERNPGNVRYGYKVVDLRDEGDFVSVTVENSYGVTEHYRCFYLVGADGGNFVGSKIGVVMEGIPELADMVTIHFKADLSEYWDDRAYFNLYQGVDVGSVTMSGTLIPIGPTWGRCSEEWLLHFGFNLNDPRRNGDPETALRRLLRLPMSDGVEILHTSHWMLQAQVASKYREGRIFIVGDACHKRPPSSGLGLNVGVDDSYNLFWKLAAVIHGKSHPALLDTYEVERRPRGRSSVDWAMMAMNSRRVVDAVVAFRQDAPQYNIARVQHLFGGSDVGKSTLYYIQKVLRAQVVEYGQQAFELGYSYKQGALVSDGTPTPRYQPAGNDYQPISRPGNRLPHAWIVRGQDEKISTLDVIRPGDDFAVLTDEHGKEWVSAVQKYAESKGLSIPCVKIRSTRFAQGGDYLGWDDGWEKVRQIDDGGVFLVRPDNFIGWKSVTPTKRGGQEIVDVIELLYSESVLDAGLAK